MMHVAPDNSEATVSQERPGKNEQQTIDQRKSRTISALLPRARFTDVLFGRSPLVGVRLNPHGRRGWISPIEARVRLGIPYGDLWIEEERYLRNHNLRTNAALLIRVFFSWALSHHGNTQHLRRPRIVSAHVDNLTIDEALAELTATPTGPRAKMVHIVHPHALNLAAFDKEFAKNLTRADLVFPDGIGVRIAGSILGTPIRHNLNGTDLLPLLCGAASEANIPLVLIGGEPGVALECATRLIRDTPGLHVPLVSKGFLTNTEAEELSERVGGIGRCIVLVGMGSPLQEAWTWRHLSGLRNVTVVTVGGLFDFFSDRKPRAPLAWRELGLEWLFRLRMEPRRLARRYLVGNPLFLMLAILQCLKQIFQSQQCLEPPINQTPRQ